MHRSVQHNFFVLPYTEEDNWSIWARTVLSTDIIHWLRAAHQGFREGSFPVLLRDDRSWTQDLLHANHSSRLHSDITRNHGLQTMICYYGWTHSPFHMCKLIIQWTCIGEGLPDGTHIFMSEKDLFQLTNHGLKESSLPDQVTVVCCYVWTYRPEI